MSDTSLTPKFLIEEPACIVGNGQALQRFQLIAAGWAETDPSYYSKQSRRSNRQSPVYSKRMWYARINLPAFRANLCSTPRCTFSSVWKLILLFSFKIGCKLKKHSILVAFISKCAILTVEVNDPCPKIMLH